MTATDPFRLFDDGPDDGLVIRPWAPEEAHAKAVARGARCAECPLYGCSRGPVMGEIRPGAKLIVIGEAPGKHEVAGRRPFVGRSGVELDEALRAGGLSRDEVSVTNVLLCQPPVRDSMKSFLDRLSRQEAARQKVAVGGPAPMGEKKEARAKRLAERTARIAATPPRPGPIECCKPRLLRDIEETGAKTILAIGGYALKTVAEHHGVHYGRAKDLPNVPKCGTILSQHGAPIDLRESGGPILTSSLHPAFAMRGKREYKHVIQDDIARAARIAVRGGIDWREPPIIVFPDIGTVEQVCNWMIAESSKGCRVVEDIETDGIVRQTCRVRCVGLYLRSPGRLNPITNDEETVIVIPFLWKDGRRYWSSKQDELRAVEAVRRVNDLCHLCGHNWMGFDAHVLHRHGMLTDRSKIAADTMLGFRATADGDLPKGLGDVVKRYFECSLWKFDADHKAGADVDDDCAYHVYCGRDVLGTGRVWPRIREDILAAGTRRQFEIDSQLAPIYAEMGDLGLVIDEVERSRLSTQFNMLARIFAQRFQDLVGKTRCLDGSPAWTGPIAPSSPQQIARWLYDRLDFTPPFDPQGHEWEEGKNPSTSLPALLRLADSGEASPETMEAIQALIEYRACTKLSSTYLDGMQVQNIPELEVLWRAPPVQFDDEVILPERNGLSILHVTWKIHVTPSGRSASSPNEQNRPQRAFAPYLVDDEGKLRTSPDGQHLRGSPTNLRRVIVAAPGHVLVASDYMQIEQRLYALNAGDEILLSAYRERDRDGKPIDPHLLNAAALFCTVDEPTPSQLMDTYHELKRLPTGRKKYVREIAKRVQYLESYGGEEDKLFAMLFGERDKATGVRTFPKIRPEDAERWHKLWHAIHPWTKRWQERIAAAVREHGYVAERVHGRRRFFRNGPSKRNAPPNMTIQGAAAAIKNEALMKLVAAIPYRSWSRWTGVVAEIHDQLVLQVPESRYEEAEKIMYDCMLYEIDGFPIPPDKPASGWTLAGL